MGRHRRSDAGRAARGRATGVTHHDGMPGGGHDPLTALPDESAPTMGIAPYLNPEAYAETYAKSEAYLFATDDGSQGTGAETATAVLTGEDFPPDVASPSAPTQGGFTGDAPAADGFAGTGTAGHGFPAADGYPYATGDGLPTGGYAGDAYPWAGLAAPGDLPGHGFPGDTYAYDRSAAATEVLDLGSLDDGGWAGSVSASDPSDTFRSRPGPSKSSFTSRDFTGGAFRSTPLRDEGFPPGGGTARGSAHRRRKKKAPTPVRSGLLGVSAAVAFGTVAVATGAVPGLENYKLGGDSSPSDSVQAGDAPTSTPTEQGGASGGSLETPGRETGSQASRDGQRATSPAPAPSTSEAAPTETPEKEDRAETPEKKPETEEAAGGATAAPDKPGNSERGARKGAASASEQAAAAQVLALVNQERAKAGCRPVTPSQELADLAAAFSEDMAKRGFFDHTDPDGATPWDRAERAGIADLGGENIARGQADAAAVMQAWMDSPGHRANILNCDFKTLGVGVHFGPGGPWWTQNFGY